MRPSLIWTWEKPGALAPVAAFTIGNALGLPFVDKPVMVDLLAAAMLNGIEASESGIFDYKVSWLPIPLACLGSVGKKKKAEEPCCRLAAAV